MDFFKNFLKKGGSDDKEDYERLLSDLDQKIQTLQVLLAETRLYERNLGIKLIGTFFISYIGLLVYVFCITQPTFSHLLFVVLSPFV